MLDGILEEFPKQWNINQKVNEKAINYKRYSPSTSFITRRLFNAVEKDKPMMALAKTYHKIPYWATLKELKGFKRILDKVCSIERLIKIPLLPSVRWITLTSFITRQLSNELVKDHPMVLIELKDN